MDFETVVVGAGISGLACAGALAREGQVPVVLERSRGVGGRCATRRIDGQPVDHGVAFLHGSDEGFLKAAKDVDPSDTLPGWPRQVEGDGPPCLPRAFSQGELRLAYASGMTAFPKSLARGLDVRKQTGVVSLTDAVGGVALETGEGRRVRARNAVLAVPAATARRLLEPLAARDREARAVSALLQSVGSQACLAAVAGYPLELPAPPWDVVYPADSAVIQTLVHDSAKRPAKAFHVLVIQARPCWSRVRMDDAEAAWAAELVAEACRLLGPWAGAPTFVQPHRWRFARADAGTVLTRPLLLRRPGGGRIVVTGESFAPGGGIEAAWLAGNATARRLIDEE